MSARTEKALRNAMERLLTGRPERTDGKLTKNNLSCEAGVSRATMNRATGVLAEWNDRVKAGPAAALGRQHQVELAGLRAKLRRHQDERRRLQEQVDAAATVIATLLAENAALRDQAARRSAVIVPIARHRPGSSLPP
ncbi:hypothetical protein HET69_34670 [Streptomyces sp. CJ_13]|uniref:hypothetical protein n=1 Tax=Streptomyces sp. CJ_13 TaxID=2724943 RepID=UPI001BDC96FA|nr:hypothetical protein [Streptomyces sp. CJ_13]MBT1188993.1 hypothetical protein [Streptomyces sp. CJ_13]